MFRCFCALLIAATTMVHAGEIRVSEPAAEKIGRKIWNNESGGTVEGLTAWNAGEDFASLGIGHFIWYPAGKRGPFEESFPKLLAYLRSNGVERPPRLREAGSCPWRTKSEFESARQSEEMRELRSFLARTVPQQTRFIIARLESALPKMLDAAPADQRDTIRSRFYAVASTPQGIYALLDYVNFKGEGTSPTERYQGEGWGMLQVLDEMKTSGSGVQAVREFSNAAKTVLTRRVRNSPPARDEARWLPGWKSRVAGYPEF